VDTKKRESLVQARRVVLKIGSQLLAQANGMPDEEQVRSFAEEISSIVKQGKEVVVVSSGAIAYGREALGWGEARSVAESQMLASVGQALLIESHRRELAAHGLRIGQVLLTHRDISHRGSYLNASTTLRTLLANRVVPVINENDAVGHEEIRFGDNDMLAALVAVMVEADALILLTQPDGLYDDDPASSPAAKRVVEISSEEGEGPQIRLDTKSSLGTGGMASKLQAARVAGKGGVPVVIASGRVKEPIRRVLEGRDVGTLVVPAKERMIRKRHWVRYGLKEQGEVKLDAGATAAVLAQGASILPVGLLSVEGSFQRGDAVSVLSNEGEKIGTGLAAYPSEELVLIAGKRSAEIEDVLGYKYLEVAIHRDDLIVDT